MLRTILIRCLELASRQDHPPPLQAPLACTHDSATTDRSCLRVLFSAWLRKILLELRRVTRIRNVSRLRIRAEPRGEILSQLWKVSRLCSERRKHRTGRSIDELLASMDRRCNRAHHIAVISRRQRVQPESRQLARRSAERPSASWARRSGSVGTSS